MTRPASERLNSAALFFLLMACYLYVFPRWADPNQNSRLDMVVAVVEDGTFQIDKYVENTVDYAKVGEHYYSDKAPGVAFLGIPVYAGLRAVLDLPVLTPLVERLGNNQAFQATLKEGGTGVSAQKVRFAIAQVLLSALFSALPTAWLAVLIYLAGARFTAAPGPRLAAALGYGLLSPAFPYANAFYGHQLAAFLLFAAFYIVFTRRKPLGVASLLVLGLLLGYSVVTEYPALLAAGVLFLYTAYALWQDRRLLGLVLPAITGGLVAAAWMAYNTQVFGGPLELGYSHSELWTAQHQTGFMSLTLPSTTALWGITFGSFRGLFFYAPLMLLGLLGFWLWLRNGGDRLALVVSLVIAVLFFAFNASSIMWWGGFAVGPRYLLPGLPFLFLPAVWVFDAWGRNLVFRLLALVLAAWSLAATWGLGLAGQAFPPDNLHNPLIQYAWPNWQAGNIARSAGTLLNLPGVLSLLPLVLLALVTALVWRLLYARGRRRYSTAQEKRRVTQSEGQSGESS